MTDFDSYSPVEFNSNQPSFGERMINRTVQIMFFLMVLGALTLAGSITLGVIWLTSMMR